MKPLSSVGMFRWEWLAPLAACALLVGASSWNYLLFHVSAELMVSCVGMMMFFISASVARFGNSHYLLVLGAGYFWVAVIGIAHTITYKGMGVIWIDDANPATQYWLSARGLQALAMLLAPSFIGRRIRPDLAFLMFGAVGVLLLSGPPLGWFPDAYVEGQGLTLFKVASEYVIILCLVAAWVRLYANRQRISEKTFVYLTISLALSCLAELCFTLYVGVYDVANVLGHVFLLLAFWLIFLATVRATLTEPFVNVVRDATILNYLPDPAYLVSDTGVVLSFNQAAWQVFGAATPGRDDLYTLLCAPAGFSREDCPIQGALGEQKNFDGLSVEVYGQIYDVRLRHVASNALGHVAVVVIRDVTDARSAAGALRRSNAELQQFAHALSHELQAPVRNMTSYLDLISRRAGPSLDDEMQGFLKTAVLSGKALSGMIHGLLKYVTLHPADGNVRELDIATVIQMSIARLRRKIDDTGAMITLGGEFPLVMGNRDQLVEVVEVLLDNALTFVPDGQRPAVEIFTMPCVDGIRVCIRDFGIGIPPEKAESVLGVFKRLQAVGEYPGDGLGIPIAQRLLEFQGSRLEIESYGHGQPGLTVAFVLPASERRGPSSLRMRRG